MNGLLLRFVFESSHLDNLGPDEVNGMESTRVAVTDVAQPPTDTSSDQSQWIHGHDRDDQVGCRSVHRTRCRLNAHTHAASPNTTKHILDAQHILDVS